MKKIAGILAGLSFGVALAQSGPAKAAQVDLRVLIVAVGDAAVDEGRAAAEQLLDNLGVPFEVLDTSQQDIDPGLLATGSHGRFNGILLSDAETYLGDGKTGFDAAEFQLLHDYERNFGVREAVLSGYPTTDPDLDLDYGMADIESRDAPLAEWQGRAGGSEIFEYVNTRNAFQTEGFAFASLPRDGVGGPRVEALLVDSGNPEYALVSVLHYADGREVLLSTLSAAPFFTHTNVLAYELLNFATNGLFLGGRHAYLSIHSDDLFLADEQWNPDANANFLADDASYRWTAAEVGVVVNAQQRFRAQHPLAAGVTIELAFNGEGANAQNDELTRAIMQHAADFGFINHTYGALQMDWVCDDPDNWRGCRRTDYATAFNDIDQNASVWRDLGLPNPEGALAALLTDSHSGLSDRNASAGTADDIPFPLGFNPALGNAATDLGIRVLAADASAPNQDTIQRVPGFELVILPRRPTALFYNTTNPIEIEAEYNYIFNGSYLARGVDPCTVPAALCQPRSYQEILDSEAAVTLTHLLSYQPFPHYFHQTNLHVYDDAGHILQFDWLEAVLARYEQYMKLPLESPRFAELGDVAWRTVLTREASPTGTLDTVTGYVTLSATNAVNIEVTGLAGGSVNGGQRILRVDVGPTPVAVARDLALDL